MGLLKVSEYAEKQGISPQAVYKKINNKELKYTLKGRVKYVVVDDNSTNEDEVVQDLKPAQTNKELLAANKRIIELEKDYAVLEAQTTAALNGKDETIAQISKQHESVVNAMNENIQNLQSSIGTFAKLESEKIEASKVTAPPQNPIYDIKLDEQPSLNKWPKWLKIGSPIFLLTLAAITLISLAYLGFQYGLMWFKL